MVGEPERYRRAEYLPGRLSGAGQYRRLRPEQAATYRRLYRTVRRHELDGHVQLNLLAMAMELASEDPAYEDVASKFWEHFIYIAHAMNHRGDRPRSDMWDERDGFFYDVLEPARWTQVPAADTVDGRT